MANIPPESTARKHRNEVHLHGVLARDPELRYTASGKTVANFSVQTTYEKRSEFHRCTAWEKLAEKLGDRFHKGDFIQLVGRLQTRSWEDQASKQKKYVTEIVVWNLSDGSTELNPHGVEVGDSDIPF